MISPTKLKEHLEKLRKQAVNRDSYNFEYDAGYIQAILDVKKYVEEEADSV